MAGEATAGAGHRPSIPWVRLATVARERALEQSAKAATASDAGMAEPHREQEAHLVRLAETYEHRAKAVSRDGSVRAL